MSTGTMAPQLRLRDAYDGPAWSAAGDGAPLLLIAGLGLDGNSWWRSIPGFAERFRVITFDYRGVGRSGRAPTSCSTDDLADDAVPSSMRQESRAVSCTDSRSAAWSHSAWRSVHPDRVSALVLGARRQAGLTRCRHRRQRSRISGGRGSSPARPPPRPPSPTSTGNAVAGKPRNASPQTSSNDASDGSTPRLIGDTSRQQCMHDAHRSLHAIDAPTLVVHGEHDRLIPKANGKLIARTIPDARLHLIPHAGHYYPTDEPSVDGLIARFFAECQ